MNNQFNYQNHKNSLDIFQAQDDKPASLKGPCSTKQSFSIKESYLLQQEIESLSQNSTFKQVSSVLKRREQNRESAKKCRIKQKERYEELQEREKQLQLELSILQNENSKAKIELQNYISNMNILNIFNNNGRTQSYNRLKTIIQSEDLADEDEINLIIDNLKNKVGVNGSQRQGKINYIFKQIIHICFPALHRYFMWTAQNGTHYFGSSSKQDGWLKNLDIILNLTQTQKQAIRSKKDIWRNQYQIFSQLIRQIKNTKAEFQKESSKLEESIYDFRQILSPVQCAKIVGFIQNNKYKQQMQLWVKRNMGKYTLQNNPSLDPGPIKKLKTEEN